MKGKYITTQIRLAALSAPVKPVNSQNNSRRRFYWDQIDGEGITSEEAKPAIRNGKPVTTVAA